MFVKKGFIFQAGDVFDEIYDVCSKELGVPATFIHDAEKGLITVDEKCFSKCFFEKAGFLTENGDDVDVEKIMKEVPEVEPEEIKPTSRKAIEKCVKAEGKNFCDRLFQMHKCYFENLPHEH